MKDMWRYNDIMKDSGGLNKYSQRTENLFYVNISINNKKSSPTKKCIGNAIPF